MTTKAQQLQLKGWLTSAAAAACLGISQKNLARFMADNPALHRVQAGRKFLYSEASVKAVLRQREQKPVQPKRVKAKRAGRKASSAKKSHIVITVDKQTVSDAERERNRKIIEKQERLARQRKVEPVYIAGEVAAPWLGPFRPGKESVKF